MRFTHEHRISTVLIAVTIMMVTILHWLGAFDFLELKTYDYRMREVRGPITGWLAQDSTAKTDVVLVEVDNESWRLIPESWPYSRGDIWGAVVENLSKAGAKVIVFDIQFDTPEPKSEYLKEIWKEFRQSDSTFSPPMHGDSVLGLKIAEAFDRGTKVVLSSKIVKEATLSPPEYLALSQPAIRDQAFDEGLVNDYLDADGFLRLYALGGYMDHEPDKMYLSLAIKAIKAFQDIPDSTIPAYNPKTEGWTYGKNRIQGLSNSNTFLINYYGPSSNYRMDNLQKWGTFPSFSVSQILDTREYMLNEESDDIDWMEEYVSSDLPDWVTAIEDTVQRAAIIEKMGLGNHDPKNSPFYGKIVLIGVSVEAIHDTKATPFYHFRNTNQYMPGVEVHAHAIQSILDSRYIDCFGQRVTNVFSYGFPWEHFLLIVAISILVFLLATYYPPIIAFLQIAFLLGCYLLLSFGLFAGSPTAGFQFIVSRIPAVPVLAPVPGDYSYWLPIAFPSVTVVVSYLAGIIHRLLVESQKKNLLKESFGTYISPELIDEMYATNQRPELGGIEGHRTAFFTDIVSFSSFSEILTPTQLVTIMNEYLSAMTDIILRNKGTLDKYIGDAIVAFWGAPHPVENQELLACKTACEMESKLIELHEKWTQEERPDLVRNIHHRIGIHSGLAVTGNMGSTKRMNYTMMGDTVNTAARLESSAKQYGIYVQVSESVYEQAKEQFDFCYLDCIRVKGKQIPIKTFELLGKKGEVSSEIIQFRIAFEKAIGEYQNGQWEIALSSFMEVLNEFSHQKSASSIANIYIDRCIHFMHTPPSEDWDGVWTLTSK